MKIGKIISELRAQNGITQEQLAEAVGVSAQAVSKWENNGSFPDITLLEPLASYFQVSIDKLMGFTLPEVEEEITRIWKITNDLNNQSKYIESIDMLKTAIKKYPSIDKLKIWLGRAYIEYGREFCHYKNDEQAKLFFTLAVETLKGVSKENCDSETLNYAYKTLFKVFMDLKQYDNANTILDKMKEYDKHASKVFEAKYYEGIGSIDKAIKLLQESLYMSVIDMINYCTSLSTFYNKKKEQEKAAKYHDILINVLKASIEPGKQFMSGHIFNNYMLMAIRYSKANRVEEAIKALENAADYAIRSMSPDEIPDAYDMIDAIEVTYSHTKPDDSGKNVNILIGIMEAGKAYNEIQDRTEFAVILNRLKEKSNKILELNQYEKIYVVFSKSGFTKRLADIKNQSNNILLINCGKIM